MKFFENSWDNVLEETFESDFFKNLIEKVNVEYNKFVVYPPKQKVFSAFKLTPFDDVKVVILGQDPYHGEGQAHGVCFSVLPGVPVPPSLQNIFKEVSSDVGCALPKNGCLVPWAKQGVLLLNSVLTVRSGEPGSHRTVGWEEFTDIVIKKLNQHSRRLVFLLWGAYAISKKKLIDESRHVIFSAPHPSPLSAYSGFFGCKHFSKTNEVLKKNGDQPIDWQL